MTVPAAIPPNVDGDADKGNGNTRSNNEPSSSKIDKVKEERDEGIEYATIISLPISPGRLGLTIKFVQRQRQQSANKPNQLQDKQQPQQDDDGNNDESTQLFEERQEAIITAIDPACTFKDFLAVGDCIVSIDGNPVSKLEDLTPKTEDADKIRIFRFATNMKNRGKAIAWQCSLCKNASFASYNDCIYHEKECAASLKKNKKNERKRKRKKTILGNPFLHKKYKFDHLSGKNTLDSNNTKDTTTIDDRKLCSREGCSYIACINVGRKFYGIVNKGEMLCWYHAGFNNSNNTPLPAITTTSNNTYVSVEGNANDDSVMCNWEECANVAVADKDGTKYCWYHSSIKSGVISEDALGTKISGVDVTMTSLLGAANKSQLKIQNSDDRSCRWKGCTKALGAKAKLGTRYCLYHADRIKSGFVPKTTVLDEGGEQHQAKGMIAEGGTNQ